MKDLQKINKEYNCFNTICNIQEKKTGKLKDLKISVKDCICIKDIESRAGSKILEGYKPVFDATVIEKVKKEGAIIIGKTSQDEFGFGSFSTNTYNIPKNPYDKTRVCGGSSGGAASATALLDNHVAIAESTGGSIACPAAFCGVYGYTPTYGLISRYGLIDYGNSLDKIGLMAKNIKDIKRVLETIKGYDEKDSTSIKDNLKKDTKVKKIAVIKESLNVNPEIRDIVLKYVKEKYGEYDEISLPITNKYGLACYYIIAMAESSTNLAKFCGMRYGASLELKGNFDEYFSKVRTKYFEKESKRRIMLGTFARMAGYRDAYYLKAAKVRTLIINEYKKAFKKYDLLISPSMPVIAPKFSEIDKLNPLDVYMFDNLTIGPNLAGLPHLSVPIGKIKNMPIGLMIIGDHLNDYKVIENGM